MEYTPRLKPRISNFIPGKPVIMILPLNQTVSPEVWDIKVSDLFKVNVGSLYTPDTINILSPLADADTADEIVLNNVVPFPLERAGSTNKSAPLDKVIKLAKAAKKKSLSFIGL
jgi:hypothetical protein